MNRSRLVAAGTSVGALIAITAGVAAANPAPSAKDATRTNRVRTSQDNSQYTDNGPSSDGQSSDDWQQLPPDPSASDQGNGSTTAPPPAFDPGAGSGLGQSNTSSGGS